MTSVKSEDFQRGIMKATGSDEEYPEARRENGVFKLPWEGNLHGVFGAMKWFLTSPNNSKVPRQSEKLDQTLPVLKPDQAALDSPPPNDIQVTWIGHATVLVQMDGINILTDPVFNDYCGMARLLGVKRYRPTPCTVEELPMIDAVCISHNHYDHLDYTTVCQLNKKFGDNIHWFVPMGLSSWMKDCGCKNVYELQWWHEESHPKFTEKDKAVKFAFTPAQHWCRRGINDFNKVLWGSWSVIGPQHRFFFAGDTGFCSMFKKIGTRYGPFDLAAIPIGAYSPRGLMEFQHVDPQAAVDIHRDVKSNFSLGIHWGTFNLSYEFYLAPPQELNEKLDSVGIPRNKFITVKHGETVVVTKNGTN